MRYMATVSVVTSDPNLFRSVAAALGDEYNIVWGNPAGGREPDLILRHWTEPGRFEGVTAVPVLVVDLWLFSGDSLRDVVGRVLHGYSMHSLPHVPPSAVP